MGPGHSIVLLAVDGSALFVWQRSRYRQDGQAGINCAVFRNEGSILSSTLIREADAVAWRRWPAVRHFTFVNAARVRYKRDPGRCFRKAGWERCGKSQGGLLIFETRMEKKECD